MTLSRKVSAYLLLAWLTMLLAAGQPACGSSGGGGKDAATDTDVATDTGAGDGNDAGQGLGPVQCRVTDDCPSDQQPPTAGGCFASRPGGVCTRCDIRNACPAGTQCVSDPVDTMVCARPCTVDGDCNRGMFCNQTGFCAQRTCAGGCPTPYVCNTGTNLCVRPACGGDAAACPSPLVCGGAFCVEP